ncbi:MAG: sodium:glutamate symporter [Spirochaetales bacterium]|nr:sodium:glutamate symporter [Spirochaetales bacterium]
MDFPWMLFVDLGIVAAGLLLASLLRARVRFFQRFLIPNALTAGFILLVFYSWAAPLVGLTTVHLRSLAYHLLNLSFVAVTLRSPPPQSPQTRRRAFSLAIGLLSHYGIQATAGLILTFAFIAFLMPSLYPAFGFLLPLGFSAGPGQAYAIGQGWERFGFDGAGSVGLTFAAVGFLWACFGGVYLINHGIKRGWVKAPSQGGGGGGQDEAYDRNSGFHPKEGPLPTGSRLTTRTEAMDSKTYHTAFILLTYFLTYLALTGLTAVLSLLGNPGRDLAASLWGIAFIFCSLVAMAVRRLIVAVGVEHTLDDDSLTRLAGLSVDLMVASALGAISIVVVTRYWLPILVMSTIAGVLALVLIPWMGSRMFPDHRFARTLIVYGAATGTLATGLALLRVVDPEFKSPVAQDYMRAAAIVFVLALPLILIINFPVYGYTSGNPMWYWLSFAVCAGYVAFTVGAYALIRQRGPECRGAGLWLPGPAA